MSQAAPLANLPSMTDRGIRYIGFLILTLFLFSGMTGLLYEIIWSRLIVKVIGAAPFAISIVLTVFMGGLGLGSYLAGKYIDRIKKPSQLLQLYGLLEIGIGIYALILPGMIGASQPLFSSIYNQSSNHLLLFNSFIMVGAVFLFIVPVILMGATLPILIRFYVAKLGHLGSRVGGLYAINTIGAALGSLLSGFLLINIWGVDGTLRFAVVMNGIIGGIAFVAANWISKRSESSIDDATPMKQLLPDDNNNAQLRYSKAQQVAALIIFAVSGFAAMAYEVIWTRLLALIIGPTTYSFSIVLTTFIIGLALGATVFGRIADRSKHPLRLLLFTQIAAGVLALFVSQFMGNSQFIFAKLIFSLKDDFVQLSLAKGAILFLLMVGPTIALGATFPLVGKIYTSSINQIGKSIGSAYAINTIGALLGSFSAGFLLIPILGKEDSISLVIGIQIITALFVFWFIYREKMSATKKVGIIAFGILGLILTLTFPHWDRQQLATGKYYRFESKESLLRRTSWWDAIFKHPSELMPNTNGNELVFYGDGIGGFTTVVQHINSFGKRQYTLYNSGKADASSESDMPTQTMAAHIPLLFHPNAKNVMILGLASGITAGEALYYDIDRLDIVEISEQVVEASKFFSELNSNVLKHAKTNLIIQDGRAHLELSDQKYDIINSEPSNPWMAGLASLFTEEFFMLAKDRLNWDGIFVQWLPSYQMDWATFSMVGRTFSKVFPNSLLMKTFIKGNDYLFIGFKGSDQLPIQNAIKNLPMLQNSPNLVLEDPRILYRLMVSDRLQKLFGKGPIHTDDKPLLEFMAPKRMHLKENSVDRNLAARRTLSEDIQDVLLQVADVEGQLNFARFMLSVYASFENMVDLSEISEEQHNQYTQMMLEYSRNTLTDNYKIYTEKKVREAAIENQIEIIKENLRTVPNKTESFMLLTNAYAHQNNYEEAIKYCKLVSEYEEDPIEAFLNLGLFYMQSGKKDEAIAYYEKVISMDPDNFEAHNNVGTLYESKMRFEDARREYDRAIQLGPDVPMAHYNLAGIYLEAGDLEKAFSACQEALGIDPEYLLAYSRLGKIYLERRQVDKAVAILEKALKIDPNWGTAQIQLRAIREKYSGQRAPKPMITNVPKMGDKEDPRYYYNRGVVAVQNQNYESAVNDFKQALKFNPEYLNALIGLGATYQALENLREAIVHYKNVLSLRPDHAGTHNNLAIVYSDVENYKLAIEHCDKALAFGFPVHPEFLKMLAQHR
ncbi:fused MFS/spermidine synthase [bacterium]|nr:fused MFS/spermidine synthase [bacterium]